MHFAQALFFLNTIIWVVLGFVSTARIGSSTQDQVLIAWIIALLMFGNAAAMLISGVVIVKPGRLGYLFALGVLAVNILLTFTDQFGSLDLVTLLIDLVLLILLIITRRGSRGEVW